eukprot:PhF_6_TR21013/c0_g1_i1/m.30192
MQMSPHNQKKIVEIKGEEPENDHTGTTTESLPELTPKQILFTSPPTDFRTSELLWMLNRDERIAKKMRAVCLELSNKKHAADMRKTAIEKSIALDMQAVYHWIANHETFISTMFETFAWKLNQLIHVDLMPQSPSGANYGNTSGAVITNTINSIEKLTFWIETQRKAVQHEISNLTEAARTLERNAGDHEGKTVGPSGRRRTLSLKGGNALDAPAAPPEMVEAKSLDLAYYQTKVASLEQKLSEYRRYVHLDALCHTTGTGKRNGGDGLRDDERHGIVEGLYESHHQLNRLKSENIALRKSVEHMRDWFMERVHQMDKEIFLFIRHNPLFPTVPPCIVTALNTLESAVDKIVVNTVSKGKSCPLRCSTKAIRDAIAASASENALNDLCEEWVSTFVVSIEDTVVPTTELASVSLSESALIRSIKSKEVKTITTPPHAPIEPPKPRARPPPTPEPANNKLPDIHKKMAPKPPPPGGSSHSSTESIQNTLQKVQEKVVLMSPAVAQQFTAASKKIDALAEEERTVLKEFNVPLQPKQRSEWFVRLFEADPRSAEKVKQKLDTIRAEIRQSLERVLKLVDVHGGGVFDRDTRLSLQGEYDNLDKSSAFMGENTAGSAPSRKSASIHNPLGGIQGKSFV